MTLTAARLRAMVNLLADQRQAHAVANLLAEAARARGMLISDLVAEALTSSSGASTSAPTFSEIDDADRTTAIESPINANFFGLRTQILGETPKAWLARTPARGEVWLAKSQVEHHGEDAAGRAILIIPTWLARKTKLA
jgi:hypothetical protein